ncbi:MAG: DUF2341 domain-containing protein [Planctomycetota bacterium]|jgi:hypothetical protein
MNFGDSTNFTFSDSTCDGHDFDANCTNNVVCTASGPSKVVVFTDYSGAGAGEALDSDSPSAGVECIWDLAPPSDAFIYCWDNFTKTTLLGSGHPYSDNDPYFEFSAIDDGGIGGYYVYWGTNPTGEPATWMGGNSAAANCSSGETTYYLRVKAQDYAGSNSANITTFAYCYHTLAAKPPQMIHCEGFLDGFSKRRKITFDTSALTGDQTNFPVLIKLDSGNFDFGTAESDGRDIRFLDPDGRHLQYEIEEYDSSGQTARIWVKVPLLTAGVTTDYIWIYYGNPDAVDAQNKNGVWDGYAAVFHFNTSASDYLDSSQNWNFARPVLGSTLAGEGVIGDSVAFNGSAWAAMNMNYSGGENSLPSVTTTVWFKSADSGGSWNSNWAFADFDRSEYWSFYLASDTGALEFSTMANGSSVSDFVGTTTGLNDNAWCFGAAVYDGTDSRLYLNGSLDNTSSNPHGGLALGTANNRYGMLGDGTEATEFNGGRNSLYYNGLIDELRISNSARSADWIKAEYLTVNDASFSTVGTEESLDTSFVIIYDSTPEFSAIVTHENSSELATHYEIDVSKTSDFSDFTDGYDGAKTALGASVSTGNQTADIAIPFGNWLIRRFYYYRIKFYFGAADVTGSPWSETGDIATGNYVNHHYIYLAPSGGGDRFPYSHAPHAGNGLTTLSEIVAAVNGDNNSNVAGTGTSSYDLTSTGKTFTVYLDDGTFTDQLTVSGSFVTSTDNYISVQRKFDAYPVINPPGDINRVVINVDHMLLSGLTVTAPLPLAQSKRGIVVTGDNATVQYCSVYQTLQGIWATDGAVNSKVYHCTFYENECGVNISAGTHTDIYNCTAYNNTNIGFVIKGNSLGGNASGTIRNCTAHSNTDGIWISSGTIGYFILDAEIYDCDIYNNSNCGVRVFSQHEATPVIDNAVIVRNNRIYSLPGQSQDYGVFIDNNSDGVWLYNNTLYNNDCASIYYMDGSDSNYCNNNIIVVRDSATAYGIYAEGGTPFLTSDYNNIYRPGSGYVGYWSGDRSSLGNWQSASGHDANSIAADPKFVDDTSAEFHLLSTAGHWNSSTLGWTLDAESSPCIDVGNPAADYSSEPFFNGDRINIGAYGGTIYASKTPFAGPANFKCLDCSTLTLTWAWDDVAGEDGYNIYNNATDLEVIAGIAVDATQTVETLLTPNTIYTRYVKYYVGVSVSEKSNVVSICTPATIPGAMAFPVISENSITINWSDNGNPGGTLYELTFQNGTHIDNTTNLQYIHTDLAADTTYYYRVRAVNHSETPTNWILGEAKTSSEGGPYVPTMLTAIAGNTSVGLAWNENGNPPGTTYQIYAKEEGGPTYTWLGDSAETAVAVSGLTTDTTYHFRVRATYDMVVFSTNASCTGRTDSTIPPPGPPGDPLVNGVDDPGSLGDDIPDFSAIFNGIGKAKWVVIQIDNDSDFLSPHWDSGDIEIGLVNPGGRTMPIPYNGPILQKGKKYHYRIKIKNEGGDESPWSQAGELTLGEYTQVLPFKGYHMLNVPCKTYGNSIQSVVGDDIIRPLYMYHWSEPDNMWIFTNPNTAFVDNRGYIIWSYYPNTILGFNGDALPDTGEYSYQITCLDNNHVPYYGYCMLRNPFSIDLTWPDDFITLDNCEGKHWRPWNGEEYEWCINSGSKSGCGSEIIPPGASFWVHALEEFGNVTMSASGGGAPPPIPPPCMQWRLNIMTRTGPYRDMYTYAGLREDVLAGYDDYDVIEIARLVSKYVSTYFEHPEWGRFAGPYTQDMRPFPDGNRVTWNMTVKATDAEDWINLSWTIPEEIQNSWMFVLKDNYTGLVTEMNLDIGYAYQANGPDTRNFTLTALETKKLILGDTNLNGEVTIEDAAICARNEHGLETLTPEQRYVSDLNSDGKVDVFDSLLIIRRTRGHLPGNP